MRKRKKTRASVKKKSKGNWIAAAVKKGGLHKSLGIPSDKKIGMSKIKKAEKIGGKVGKQANLAETLGKLRKK